MNDQTDGASDERREDNREFERNIAIEEFKSVRSLIELNFKLIDNFENYALAAYAAIFTWSQSPDPNNLKKYSTVLLPTIAIVCSLKVFGYFKAIEAAARYEEILENRHRSLGWITYYKKYNTDTSVHISRILVALIAFEVGIIVVCRAFH